MTARGVEQPWLAVDREPAVGPDPSLLARPRVALAGRADGLDPGGLLERQIELHVAVDHAGAGRR